MARWVDIVPSGWLQVASKLIGDDPFVDPVMTRPPPAEHGKEISGVSPKDTRKSKSVSASPLWLQSLFEK